MRQVSCCLRQYEQLPTDGHAVSQDTRGACGQWNTLHHTTNTITIPIFSLLLQSPLGKPEYMIKSCNLSPIAWSPYIQKHSSENPD